METKERALFDALERLQSVIVAYSGGADSAYLVWAAQQKCKVHPVRLVLGHDDFTNLPNGEKGLAFSSL